MYLKRKPIAETARPLWQAFAGDTCSLCFAGSMPAHEVYAEVIAPDSQQGHAVRMFQAARFAQVQRNPETNVSEEFVETTDINPDRSLLIGIYGPSSGVRDLFGVSPTYREGHMLIGAARLELQGAMLSEHVMRFRPGSVAATALAAGRVAEIGGLATLPRLAPALVLDALDALCGLILHVARTMDVEWFWIFPRNGFMTILWAEWEDVLPAYHFEACNDIAGWDEQSERLQQFRSLGLRGLSPLPVLYQITRERLAHDLDARVMIAARRHLVGDALGSQLRRAMVRAAKQRR